MKIIYGFMETGRVLYTGLSTLGEEWGSEVNVWHPHAVVMHSWC